MRPTEKAQAHRLLDQLDPIHSGAISRLLEVMANPISRALAAARADDEPITEQDRGRFHKGQACQESPDQPDCSAPTD